MKKRISLIPIFFFICSLLSARGYAHFIDSAADTGFNKITGKTKIEVKVSPMPLLVPVSGKQSRSILSILLRNCPAVSRSEACTDLPEGNIELTLLNASVFPFVTMNKTKGKLDINGYFSSVLNISSIEKNNFNLPDLWDKLKIDLKNPQKNAAPLSLKIQIKAYLNNAPSPTFTETFNLPFDLALIKGITVGPTIKPRSEKSNPILHAKNELSETYALYSKSSTREGEFFILFKPGTTNTQEAENNPAPQKDLFIKWSRGDHILLQMSLSYLKKLRGLPEQTKAGELIDIGSIDLLEPYEHEKRIGDWVKEFINSMHYDNGNLSNTLSSLNSIPCKYEASGIKMPHFIAGLDSIGEIQIPEKKEEFWGMQSSSNQAPPYVAIMHEFGHFVHKHMVDRWATTCLWTGSYAESENQLWSIPKTLSSKGQMLYAFYESSADFFAYLLFNYLDLNHPEFKGSIYHDRGYLTKFDSDEKALSSAPFGGCRVEGIQSVFLRNLYSSYIKNQPALAYGDYLKIIDTFRSESWVMERVPAHHIIKWLDMKIKHGGLTPVKDLAMLTSLYQMKVCELGITVYPADTKNKTVISIDGKQVTLEKENLLQMLSPGETVIVENGMIVVVIQKWTGAGEVNYLAAYKGSQFRIITPYTIEHQKGILIIDGQITVHTLNGTIAPSGTSFAVNITTKNQVEIQVLEGSVAVVTLKGSQVFKKGTALSINARGKISEFPPINIATVKSSFMPPEILIPVVQESNSLNERLKPVQSLLPPPDEKKDTPPATAPHYYVIHHYDSGKCIIVQGSENLSSGDIIINESTSFEQALGALDTKCQLKPTDSNETPKPPPIISPSLEHGNAEASHIASLIALPQYDGDTTKGIFLIKLDTGNVTFFDGVEDSPEKIRSSQMDQNIFSALGRASLAPAKTGEILAETLRKKNGSVSAILLVDTTTGAMSYITDLDDKPRQGKIKPIPDYPAHPVASSDNNYTLLMRNDSSDEINGTYLCHITNGKCLFFNEINKFKINFAPLYTSVLPVLKGKLSLCNIHTGSKAVTQFFAADNVSGNVYTIKLDKKDPEKLATSKDVINLFDVFSSQTEVSLPVRFILIPVLLNGENTKHIFIIDAATGETALLKNVTNANKIKLVKANRNIYEYLNKNPEKPGMLAAAPRLKNGSTKGAWIFDSITDTILYFENLDEPENLKIKPVEIRTK